MRKNNFDEKEWLGLTAHYEGIVFSKGGMGRRRKGREVPGIGATGWTRRGALAFPQKKESSWVLSGAYLAGATTAHSAPTTTSRGGGNAKSRRQTQRRKSSGSGRRGNSEKSEVFHGTHFICPASRWPGVGSGTFRAVEGCQRVREPSLSPLLYKKVFNCPTACGEVPLWWAKYTGQIFL